MPVWAMTDVQALETQLIEEGESPSVLLKLARGYADLEDGETAQLYLEYLRTTFPDFAAASKAELATLEARIASLLNPDWSDSLVGLYQLTGGVDTNASQGTSLSQLDLQLANGEKLVLAVNADSRATRSAYVGGKVMTAWSVGEGLTMRGALEHLQYTDHDVASMTLGSLELASEQHSVAVYGFERFGTRVGLAYRGSQDSVFWGAQIDDEEHKLSGGVRGVWDLPSDAPVRWSSQVFHSASDGLGGASNARVGLQMGAAWELDQLGVQYSVEYARDQSVYDPIFFPGVRDRYVWQRMSLAIPLVGSVDQRVDLIVAYNNKEHDVSINSWQGIDFRVVLSAPLQ